MGISVFKKRVACELLLQHYPKKTLARELGVSEGALRDWRIYIEHDNFEWVEKISIQRQTELLNKAARYWYDHYPIGYTEVAKRFGIRPANLYAKVKRHSVKTLCQARLKKYNYAYYQLQQDTTSVQDLDSLLVPGTQLTADLIAKIKEEKRINLLAAKAIYEVLLEEENLDNLKKKELKALLNSVDMELASLRHAKSSE